MPNYKTKAIIINRLNLGESDRLLTLFSLDKGKIRVIAKGSRRTKSKFSGHTELFTLCDFILSTGKSLDIVNDATLLENYLASDPDIEKVKSAYFFGEVISKLLPDNQPNEDVFELFSWCLDNLKTENVATIRLIFVARILRILGIYPELSKCIRCENKPEESTVYFSQSAGGIIDKGCSLHFTDATRTDKNIIKLWRYLADSDYSSLLKIQTEESLAKATSELATSYLACVTMIDYRSIRVLS